MLFTWLLRPAIAARAVTLFADLRYLTRGIGSVCAEWFGLPQAIPDDRKMDYLFRDVFWTSSNVLLTEATFRFVDRFFTTPRQLKTLALDRLSSIYTPRGTHTPKALRNFVVKNHATDFPYYLRDYLLGSVINSRSYPLVPDQLEHNIVKKMIRENKPHADIQEARLIEHHLRRLLTPERYVDKYLRAEGHVSAKEAQVLHKQLQELDKFSKLTNKVVSQEKGGFSKLFKDLGHRLTNFGKAPAAGPNKALEAAKELSPLLKKWAKEPALKQSKWVQHMAQLTPEGIIKKIKGPTIGDIMADARNVGPRKAWENFQQFENLFPDKFLSKVSKKLLEPTIVANYGKQSKMHKLFKSLALSKVQLSQFQKVFKGNEVWLKIPLGILAFFLSHGVLCNYLDVKFVQPFQDKLVKERGHSKDAILPAILGLVPGVAALALTYRSTPIKALGYFYSYLVSAAVGLGVYTASAWAMFKYSLSKPSTHPNRRKPETPQKPEAPKTPGKEISLLDLLENMPKPTPKQAMPPRAYTSPQASYTPYTQPRYAQPAYSSPWSPQQPQQYYRNTAYSSPSPFYVWR